MSDAILILTARGPERILREGGSQAWVLDPKRARRCGYAVLVQNRDNGDWGGATEPHHKAFMVGRVADVVPATDVDSQEGRWLVQFSEYAEVDIRNAWPGLRNPIFYTTLNQLKIDVSQLEFRPMPSIEAVTPALSKAATAGRPLTIMEAKQGLAASFGVSTDAIEITIRA